LAALLLTFVGIATTVRGLLLKMLSGAAVYRTRQLIDLNEIFVVQANISMTVAQ
jgi:hypothetical protein